VQRDARDGDALELAEAAHALVESDAARAAALAGHALTLARARRQPEAEVAALHALGFARRELGDARTGRTLRAAVRVGERHGLTRRAALARRPLAIHLAYAGSTGAALRELDAACAALDGLDLARCEVSRIAVLGLAGRTPDLAASDRALGILRREGDAIWEARLLKNRGVLLAERGDTAAAEPDLVKARDLYARLGATTAAVGAEYELARLALARGDLPTCLARLDAIDAADVPALRNAALELLRAKALVTGRLLGEARQALDIAQATWRQAGIEEPEGTLDIVALILLAGEPREAQSLARRAQRSFAARGRHVYAARAAGLALSAANAAGTARPSGLRAGRRAATTLSAAGWREEALRVRLAVARAAIQLGARRVARQELAACAPLRRRGPVADRIEAWHVEALARLAVGDRRGAQSAARHGLGLLESYRAALGATDLRATASEIGLQLAALGVRIALGDDDGDVLLAWAERLRASALRLPPVTTPDGAALRESETELRRVTAAIRLANREGRPARALVARQAVLEAVIRRLARHRLGGPETAQALSGRRPIARALGEAALVELIELDDSLTALVLVDGQLTRHELGETASVKEQLEWLRFALGHLARSGQTPAQRETALAGARACGDALGQALIEPLAQTVGDRALVLVPTGSLHTLPWALLPQLRGRSLVVTPSAMTWLDRQVRRRRRRPTVAVVAGPRLRYARAEAVGVSALYGDAAVLTGRAATAAAVMHALDGAAVAHLACHGHFRSDSPLFSSLELADGPLNAYELQRLRRAPELIVLSACDLAVSDARPGDELLGIAAALLGMGTRTVIASVVAAPDASTKRLMIALHRHLTQGLAPAVALASVQSTLRPREAPLAGFICLGSG
jgi:CHAT domain-containing protein